MTGGEDDVRPGRPGRPRPRRVVDSPLTPGSAAARAGRSRALLALVTAVLLVGFLLGTVVLPGGPAGLDWNRLVARWASPLWWTWDLLLVLALGSWVGALLLDRRRRGTPMLLPLVLAVLGLALAVVAVIAVVGLGRGLR